MKFLFIIFFLPSICYSDLNSPFFLHQGGAGGASLKEDFSYLLNPATIAFQRKTKGAIAYSFKNKEQSAYLSFLDLKTGFPIAISYQNDWTKSITNSKNKQVSIGSAFRLTSYFSFGISVEKELTKSLWNGNLGSLLKIGNTSSLALYLNQVLLHKNQNQRILSLALYHHWKKFFITKVDISKSYQEGWILKAGLESVFHKFFSIRVGTIWFHKIQKGFLSGGLAFISPKITLEYGIEKQDKASFQQALVLSLKI